MIAQESYDSFLEIRDLVKDRYERGLKSSLDCRLSETSVSTSKVLIETRQLYPKLDIVSAAKPVFDEWKDQQTNLKSVISKLQKDSPEIKRTIEELPNLAKQFLNTDLKGNKNNEDFLKSVSKSFYQSLLGLAVMLVGGVLLGLEVLAGWWLLGFGFIVLLLSKPK